MTLTAETEALDVCDTVTSASQQFVGLGRRKTSADIKLCSVSLHPISL